MFHLIGSQEVKFFIWIQAEIQLTCYTLPLDMFAYDLICMVV